MTDPERNAKSLAISLSAAYLQFKCAINASNTSLVCIF
jgi:hypothetical protein